MKTLIPNDISIIIQEHAKKEYYAESERGAMFMLTRRELNILSRIEAIEFGYHLALQSKPPLTNSKK